MKHIALIIVLALLFAACGNDNDAETAAADAPTETVHEQFFNNVASLCGETFSGESTYPDDPDHDLVDTELVVNIVECEENMIKVNLHRDTDTWHATWVLEKRENGLHLYHDHIGEREYEEGEEPLTGYGGYADDQGDATTQFFPADDHTAEILPEASTNVWMMSMNLEEESFIYYLERHNEPRFRAEVFRN